MLREHLAHAVEPALQVDRPDAGDECHLAFPAEQLDRLLAHDASRRLVVHAIERDPLRLRRIGVPGDNGNAGVHGPVDGIGQEIAVQTRDRDPVDSLGNERLENFLLAQLIGVLRPAPDHLDIPELLRLALGAHLGVVEDRQIQRFRNHREPKFFGATLVRTAAPDRRDSQHNRNDLLHGVIILPFNGTPRPYLCVLP